jgi:uncharacterized protein
MNFEAAGGINGFLLLGLLFGAGACNVTCLPFLGPVLLARSDRERWAWRTMLPFSLGRLCGYAVLGGGAGLLGANLDFWLEGDWYRRLLALGAMVAGLVLLLRFRDHRSGGCGRDDRAGFPALEPRPNGASRALLPGALFAMGLGMAFNPACGPLAVVVLAAAATADIWAGLILGLSFGIGAAALPFFIFACLVASIGTELKRQLAAWRTAMERGAAFLLMGLGLWLFRGW